MSGAQERLARVTLSRVSEPGYPPITGLTDRDDAVSVLNALLAKADDRDLGSDLAERLRDTDPGRELERAESLGIRFVTPADDEWPAPLDDLRHAPKLHERGGVPVGLWVKGPMRLDEAAEHAVAVVGSRSATTYGGSVAGELGSSLGRAGYTVVSGAAVGIDQAGHRGALAARGPTIAVLACGVDRAYPANHKDLLDYIADVGLVVSESPPGCAPTRIRFLARNRIIAGLSRGTVVVEAAIRSGALNTAGWAAGLGRVVMGVPGPVTSAPSEGVHQLIRCRGALLVTRGDEVLEAVGPIGSLALPEPRAAERPRDRITHVERQVLDAVPVTQGVDLARVSRTAGFSPDRTLAALGSLTTAGLVEHHDGRWRLAEAAR